MQQQWAQPTVLARKCSSVTPPPRPLRQGTAISILFRLVSTLEQAAGFTKTQTPLFQHHSQGVQPVRIWLASTPSRLGAQWGHPVSAHAQADSLQQGPASREEPIATSKGQPPKSGLKSPKASSSTACIHSQVSSTI